MDNSATPEIRIFVSYAREDKRWLDPADPHNLIPFLVESLRRDNVSFWTDNDLRAGEEYKKSISQQIDGSQVAILIVSQHFLNSEFIESTEMPQIQQRAEGGELVVVPILVEPCAWQEYPLLASRQMIPGPRPLIEHIQNDADWAQVRFDILSSLKLTLHAPQRAESSSRPAVRSTSSSAPVLPPSQFAPQFRLGNLLHWSTWKSCGCNLLRSPIAYVLLSILLVTVLDSSLVAGNDFSLFGANSRFYILGITYRNLTAVLWLLLSCLCVHRNVSSRFSSHKLLNAARWGLAAFALYLVVPRMFGRHSDALVAALFFTLLPLAFLIFLRFSRSDKNIHAIVSILSGAMLARWSAFFYYTYGHRSWTQFAVVAAIAAEWIALSFVFRKPQKTRLACGIASPATVAVLVFSILFWVSIPEFPSNTLDYSSGHVGPVLDVEPSLDGQKLFSIDSERNVKVRDIDGDNAQPATTLTVSTVRSQPGPNSMDYFHYSSTQFSPDLSAVLATDNDGKCTDLWSLADGALIDSVCGADGVRFGSGGTSLVSWSESGKYVLLSKIADGKLTPSMKFMGTAVSQATTTPDNQQLVFVVNDNVVNFLNTDKSSALKSISLAKDGSKIRFLSFSPTGQFLIAQFDSDIVLWDMKIQKIVRILKCPKCSTGSVRISPNGHVVAAIVDDIAIALWNIDSGKSMKSLQGRNIPIESFAFTPDGRTIVSGNTDSTIKYWDVGFSLN
ncbi:MAG: toll/interleukin-1 receptor domain-containing protein [Terracidiphilus sp.]|nr:toll/interleukin-1 receptor domain-containing protein [Terracidiphilus sp.]